MTKKRNDPDNDLLRGGTAVQKSGPAASDPAAPGPQDPYPTGNPPDPEDVFEQAHGYRRTPKKE